MKLVDILRRWQRHKSIEEDQHGNDKSCDGSGYTDIKVLNIAHRPRPEPDDSAHRSQVRKERDGWERDVIRQRGLYLVVHRHEIVAELVYRKDQQQGY